MNAYSAFHKKRRATDTLAVAFIFGTLFCVLPSLIQAQTEDTEPPMLIGVIAVPSQVDTLASNQVVQVTRTVTDDLSGVAYSGNGCTGFTSGLVFTSPSGSQSVKVNNCAFTLVSGTALNGDFSAPATFRQYAENGIWPLTSMILEDQAGNVDTLSAIDLSSLGINLSVEVTSPGDLAPPVPTNVFVSPQQVDTSASAQVVQVIRAATDDLSGVAYQGAGCSGFTSGLVLVSPSGNQEVKINNCGFSLTSGSALNGEFTGAATFPQFAEIGVWQLQSMILEDQAGNFKSYASSELASLGISATVEVVSPGDIQPPVLVGLNVSPQLIDTSQSGQAVQVTRTLTDDVSGVAYNGAGCTGFTDGLVFSSPTGIQSVKINNCEFILIGGSDLNGDFAANANFPQFAESGIWPLISMILEDQAGNSVTLYEQDLISLGLDMYVEVALSAPIVSCSGFEAPMANYPVKAKKNRAFPLKFELYDSSGHEVMGVDLNSAPVIQVIFTSANGGAAIDVTDDALSSGQGTDGNQFVFTEDGKWQFNLKSNNYTAEGEYLVSAIAGDEAEYTIDPTCVTSFVVE